MGTTSTYLLLASLKTGVLILSMDFGVNLKFLLVLQTTSKKPFLTQFSSETPDHDSGGSRLTSEVVL